MKPDGEKCDAWTYSILSVCLVGISKTAQFVQFIQTKPKLSRRCHTSQLDQAELKKSEPEFTGQHRSDFFLPLGFFKAFQSFWFRPRPLWANITDVDLVIVLYL